MTSPQACAIAFVTPRGVVCPPCLAAAVEPAAAELQHDRDLLGAIALERARTAGASPLYRSPLFTSDDLPDLWCCICSHRLSPPKD